MKTITYEGVQHGDWVRCVLCGAQMLLPCGADKCPECGENGTLRCAGTVKLTNLDNGESNISFPSCDDGLIINPADKHIK